GTNNSGKSSLIEAIYLLTQNRTKNHSVLSLNEELELGYFSDILHKSKDSSDTIEFSVNFSEELIAPAEFKMLEVTFSYNNPIVFNHIDVAFAEPTPILSRMQIQYIKEKKKLHLIDLEIVDQKGKGLYQVKGDSDTGYCTMLGCVPGLAIYKDLEKKERGICSADFETIRDYLSLLTTDNIKYLKALRLADFTDRNTSLTQYMGLAGEFTAEIIYKNWSNPIDFPKESGEKYTFSELFDVWIKKLLGDDFRARAYMTDSRDQKYRIVIEEVNRGLELNLKQVGVGISQVLPIITMLLVSKEKDILLIENPEVHLHPKLQALFVDLCIFAIENNRKLVVETHSEHVVNRLRYNVKTNPSLIEKINVLFLNKSGGDVTYTTVHISADGQIDFWPEDFFDQSYKDLLGLLK
ncbi:MAG: DUF3696 domain-containing protein, partial [bacterium]|nr:DUF3696 domain-containing protein [bacterium]